GSVIGPCDQRKTQRWIIPRGRDLLLSPRERGSVTVHDGVLMPRNLGHRAHTAGITSPASRSICSTSSTSGFNRISSAPACTTSRTPATQLAGGPVTITDDQPARP